MADDVKIPKDKTTPAAPKRRWGKRIGMILAIIFIPLVVGYFVATSTAFFKKVILPRVSKQLNADVTVADASIKPFSGVVLTQLKVQPKGQEPILEARQLTARYKLTDIMGGNINVSEVSVIDPVIRLVENADGTKNTDVFTKKPGQSPAAQSSKPETQPSSTPTTTKEPPPQLNIRNVSLKNATFQNVKKNARGQEVTEISQLNVSIDQLKNGSPGKFTIAANLKADPGMGTNNIRSLLEGKMGGEIGFVLGADLMPTSAKGAVRADVNRAEGTFAELAGLAAVLDTDWTPTEVKNVAVRFERGGQPLSQMRIAGPFDSLKKEGRLKMELSPVDRQVLNLFVASKGWDMGKTTFTGTSDLTFAQAGTLITVVGQFNGNQVSITQTNQSTPAIDLVARYDVTVDQAKKSATLRTVDLRATQAGKALIESTLDKPMVIAFGGPAGALPESNLRFAVNQLNLPDWKVLLGDTIQSGLLQVNADVSTAASGEVRFNATKQISNLAAQFGSNRLEQASIQVKLNTSYRAQEKQKNIVGGFELVDFSGRIGETKIEKLQSKFDYDVAINDQDLRIKKAGGTFSQNGRPGGGLNVSGNYHLEKSTGNLALELNAINQNALAPFLAGPLGDKQLINVLLSGTANAKLSEDNREVTADLGIKDLVVKRPDQPKADEPLAAQLKLSSAYKGNVLDIPLFQLTLTPTERAKNQLDVKGRIDMSQTNAARGKLVVSAEALDITRYYELYAGGKPPAETPASQPRPRGTPAPRTTNPSSTPAPSPAPPAEDEPGPIKLPVDNFVLGLDIGHFYLHEIDLSKIKAEGTVTSGRLVLNPLELACNGAPVKGAVDIDLSVKGFVYNISFSADRVPLEPIANTFQPERKGLSKGAIIGTADIRGRGFAGANLRKHLNGHVGFSFTNANIGYGPKMNQFLVAVGAVLQTRELNQSPLNWVNSRLEFGQGNINIPILSLQSEAFQADCTGVVPIADILTNSPLRMPLNFQLRRSLAEKSRMLPANAPADAKYVALPSFLGVKGTIGSPDPDINESAVLKFAAQKGLQALGKDADKIVGGDAGRILGNLLGGGNQATNAAPPGTISSPAQRPNTNSSKANAADLLRGVLGGARQTNNAAGAATNSSNTATNKPKASDILRGILGN